MAVDRDLVGGKDKDIGTMIGRQVFGSAKAVAITLVAALLMGAAAWLLPRPCQARTVEG